MTDRVARNARMAERIAATPVRYPFSFVIAGDSGAWPDPTADAIFAQLLRQIAGLRAAPVFLAHLGDFAGPGTVARHQHYLELAARVEIPNVCLIGNHDLEDPGAAAAWTAVHGPRNFHFAHGTTRFVAIDGASGQAGDLATRRRRTRRARASRRSRTWTRRSPRPPRTSATASGSSCPAAAGPRCI